MAVKNNNVKEEPFVKLTDDFIYNFCLEWQLGYPLSHDELINVLKQKNVNFKEFKKAAMKKNWYILSMDVIEKVL